MSYDALPGLVADLLHEQRTTNERLAAITTGLAAALEHAYKIQSARVAAGTPDFDGHAATPVSSGGFPPFNIPGAAQLVEVPAKADEDRAELAAKAEPKKRVSKAKTEPAATTTAAPVESTPLPPPAAAPATVTPSKAEADKAALMTLLGSDKDRRAKALALIRRDDPTQKFEALPDARRAEILAALQPAAA